MPNNEILNLLALHRGRILSYANTFVSNEALAEDVVQEAYFRFHIGMKTNNADNPLAYLYRIVRNLALDNQRRVRFEECLFTRTIDEQIEQIPDNRTSLEDAVIAKDELQQVFMALEKLPDNTRIALEMHRFGGYTLRQIAQHFGFSKSKALLLVKDGVKHCQRHLNYSP